jgi:hypothetical protein
MDRKEFQNIDMLNRVVEFGTTRVGLFPQKSFAGQSFSELGTALSKVSEHATLHSASRSEVRTARKVREAAREHLRTQVRRISVTADAISAGTTDLDGQFRIPKWTSDRQLIHTAKVFAEAAAGPLKKEFIKHRLPNDFIENLNNAIEELERAIEQQVASRTRQASAVTALESDFAECQALLKRVEAVVKNTIGDDPVTMAEWNTRRQVVRRSRPVAAEEPPASEPPAAAQPTGS